MTTNVVAFVFLISVVAAWTATRAAIPMLRRKGLIDVPNARSSHDQSTPRGGGVGILAGLAAGLVAFGLAGGSLPGWPLLVGAGLVAACGFLDDRNHGLPVSLRLAVHTLAAALVVGLVGGLPALPLPEPVNLPAGVLGVPIALLWIVGVTNLFNFLDGIDGLAAMQGIIAGCGLALIAPGPASMLGIALAGACAGFLAHNWHPARIFMGDVGSTTLGFVLAAAPFELAPDHRPDTTFAIGILLWFFLADGTFTLARRLLNGEKVWKPHRSHLYQRLVVTGLRHDQVTLLVHTASACLAIITVAALVTQSTAAKWLVLVVAAAAFIVYIKFTVWREQSAVANTRA